ncbi:MAG TPA: hypothetical protein PLG79_07945 [Spirochaetales bacterium]|nr:hypothetical protein [Spirochaetales bacterium]
MNVELTGCIVHVSPGKSKRVVVMNENGLLELWADKSLEVEPGIYHGYTVLVAIRQYKGKVFLNLVGFQEE